MSYDDTDNERTADGSISNDEAPEHITVQSRTGSAITGGFPAEVYQRVEDGESVEFIDPKGEDNIECPVNGHPAASEHRFIAGRIGSGTTYSGPDREESEEES